MLNAGGCLLYILLYIYYRLHHPVQLSPEEYDSQQQEQQKAHCHYFLNASLDTVCVYGVILTEPPVKLVLY